MTPHLLQDPVAVVIGASAGGVEALGVLLPALNAHCRATVLIVLHLPRERPSLLRDLYSTRCALPVCEIVDKQPVEPGTVYFAPPDYHLLIECDEGATPSFALSVDDAVHYSRPSIDVLFESAAACWGNRVMAVVLSGASEDGARGLAAVAVAGGTTVAQEPEEAAFPVLPAAALRTGQVQHQLKLEAIRQLFSGIGHSS